MWVGVVPSSPGSRKARKHSSSFKIGTVRSLQHKVNEKEWETMADFLAEIRDSGAKLTAIGTGGNINRLFKENKNALR
jgi:exopolyphosphatase/guanosine-5'-triphosphate,3'-diphosphate pyrophosphatase